MSEVQAQEIAKLRQFLKIAMVMGTLFSAGHLTVWAVTGYSAFGVVSALIAAYLCGVGVGSRALARGHVAATAQLLAYGLLALVGVGGAILPLGYTAAVVGCILAVSLGLPFLPRARLALLAWAAAAVASALVLVGVLTQVPPVPRWVQVYGSVGPTLGFSFLVVWMLYTFASGEHRMRLRAQQARDEAVAEREASRFLADASRGLLVDFDYPSAVQGLAALAVPALADYCTVEELGERGARWAGGAHRNPVKELLLELEARSELHVPAHPARRALAEGRTVYVPAVDDTALGRYARSPEHLELLRALNPGSLVAVPLGARGRRLGVALLARERSREKLTPRDVTLIEELALRAALAIDNARLYRQAQHAVRARDEFLSVASHELKTPLTPLKLHLSQLRRGAGPLVAGEMSARWLERHLSALERQSDRLLWLINELLDIGGLGGDSPELQLKLTDWTAVVRMLLTELEQSGELESARSPLVVELGGPLIGRWDPSRLRIISKHLVLNALKYGKHQPVTVRLEREGDFALFTVADQGIGIPLEDQERVFEPFERAVSVRNYGGLGLGLFLVRRSLEAMGGEIALESSPGHGATFRGRLPLRGPDA